MVLRLLRFLKELRAVTVIYFTFLSRPPWILGPSIDSIRLHKRLGKPSQLITSINIRQGQEHSKPYIHLSLHTDSAAYSIHICVPHINSLLTNYRYWHVAGPGLCMQTYICLHHHIIRCDTFHTIHSKTDNSIIDSCYCRGKIVHTHCG